MDEYRGHRRRVSIYQNGDRYRVDVIVKTGHGANETHFQVPAPPVEWSAATEREAQHYGVDLAKAWIDQKLGGPAL